MEKGLVELGLQVYQVAGIIGVMAFLLVACVLAIIAFWARLAKRQTRDIEEARKEVRQIQEEMTKSLKDMLEECEQNCAVKDSIIEEQRKAIETYRRNEIFLQTEIAALQTRIEALEGELS